MNFTNRTIFIISADPKVAQECADELAVFGGRYRTSFVNTIEQARTGFLRTPPTVVFLDEPTIGPARGGESLESAVSLLTETSPVVVAAAPEKQSELVFLITAGAVDFVPRILHFVPVAASMLERRMRVVERVEGMIQFPHDVGMLTGDFGEILRHELNNPLTGILGNTELLLARREHLPPAAVERLQTIAELAVRLRETVRRLSNSWEEHREPAGPV
ncbi:MAG TPA: histidine kinase dimerization/phospho-acceptor domain-containing protein [Candidatus Dormibacteraeota bacterium]|nr:histidine kinase dimerization/phospho-acceptor domain-containing protein [Candidatus Dormibacteraeota bacterium]